MPRTTFSSGRRLPALAATLTLGLAVALAGCAEDSEPTGTDTPTSSATSEPTTSQSPSESGSATPAPEGQVIDITVEGDTVTPSGERVEAKVGEEITLRVTADAPGEIHVHSTPEQELEYAAGTTDLPLTIDAPGLVDVESHTLDMVIVQLEVR